MARIELPYGKGSLPLEIDDTRLAAVLAPHENEQNNTDEAALVRTALASPIGSPRLSALARGKRRVLVITSDHTRPVPSKITLPPLLAEIRAGNPEAEIRILIATGTHRPMTAAEMHEKFGAGLLASETFINHVCTDEAAMVHKGTLPSGGALWLNDLVDWAELMVAEGFIEPHFFAGFSGGRKAVLPGIASQQTVLYNHNAAFLKNEHARQGCLDGNPLHKDMAYAAEVAGLAFILNVLLDGQKRVTAAFAGHPDAAHKQGCDACLAQTRVRRVAADIVITSNGGYPLDQNVYQSVKGMTAAEACVRKGGVIVMCAAVGDGAGGDAFYHWLADRKDAHAVAAEIQRIAPEETQPDQWEAQILARVLCHATVVFVTGEENKTLIEAMHMTWAGNLDDALLAAGRIVGEDAQVVVIPDGVGVIVA